MTRESSFHLPDQQLCETTLQDDIIILSPHLYSLHAGWGTFPEVSRSGPGGIPTLFWLFLFQETWRLRPSILQHPSSRRRPCMMFRLRQPHTWWASELCVAFREQSGEGQSPLQADAMALPIPGHSSTDLSLIFQRWSVTGTTTKFRDPVALKGTVMERNPRDTVSSFCFFLPVLLRAPNRGQTHFAAEIGNVSPHSRAHLWVCFRSLNSKIAFYQGSHYTLDVTVPIKTCWLCGWQTELVYHTHSVATS